MLSVDRFEAMQGGSETSSHSAPRVGYVRSYSLTSSVSSPTADAMHLLVEAGGIELAAGPALRGEELAYRASTPAAYREDAGAAIARVLNGLRNPPIRLTGDELREAEGDSV